MCSEAAGIMRGPFALAEAVQDYVRGSPLSGHVAKVSDESRAALVGEVGDAWAGRKMRAMQQRPACRG
jgi:hypothetical protein